MYHSSKIVRSIIGLQFPSVSVLMIIEGLFRCHREIEIREDRIEGRWIRYRTVGEREIGTVDLSFS